MPDQTEEILRCIYQMAHRDIDHLLSSGDDDFSFSIPGLSRFRINAYKQRGSLAAVIRVIAFQLPDPAELSIPEDVMSLAELTKGMVLVTGSAGSGKSTTMACLIDRINHSREGHIITLEDPLEYLHRHDRCIVSQREICSRLCIKPSTVTVSLQRMEKAALIYRVADAKDKRIQRIYLTDSGKEIHREVEKIRKEVGSVMLQGMTPEEVDHLKKQILQMQENMEKMPGSTEIKDYL